MQQTRTASLCSQLTPTVRCASEEGLVSYLGPCLSSQGSRVSTPDREPGSQRTVHTQTIRPRASDTTRPEPPSITSPPTASSSPTWLGLGHTLPAVSRAPAPSDVSAILAPVFGSSRQPGVSKCPVSRLIAFGAPLRHQRPLRTPPELPWQGCALVPDRAHQQRLHAHLTRRAVDSHSFAVLATDAHG